MTNEGLTEQAFAEIIAENGGRAYRVGGCVRDAFMGIAPKDIDYCVTGMVKKNFKTLFPAAVEYGKAFPVFQLPVDGAKCEVAFARTERKVGSGYKGFKVASNPKVTIQEDLYRRDTTVNSMAVDCLTGTVIDPFNGQQDIHARILRATSLHFAEDPIRALRLAGQAARLDFQVDPGTLELASTVRTELIAEPAERVLAELRKVLAEAQKPSRFFQVLAAAELLMATFAELASLAVEDFASAMARLDGAAGFTQNSVLRFASLGFSLDIQRLNRWNDRMTLPGDWLAAAAAAGKVAQLLLEPTPETIVDAVLSLRRGSLSIEDFDLISKAAGLSLPALQPFNAAMAGNTAPAGLKGREIGAWLRERHLETVARML